MTNKYKIFYNEYHRMWECQRLKKFLFWEYWDSDGMFFVFGKTKEECIDALKEELNFKKERDRTNQENLEQDFDIVEL